MVWSWDFMLQVFRGLGGVADNAARKESPWGRGIVPKSAAQRVYLQARENLIFPVSDIEFVDNRLKLKASAAAGQGERAFFENYYASLSWAGGGEAEGAAFMKQLDELPQDVRTLAASFGMERLLAGGEARVQQWFLQSRHFVWRGVPVLVPVLDLVDHDAFAPAFSDGDGVSVLREPGEEVTVSRSIVGPFGAFVRFGFPSHERVAFSLPFTFKTANGCEIKIGQNINLSAKLGPVSVPEFDYDESSVRFSSLMIGSSRSPRLPRTIFYRIMAEAKQPNAEQVFDRIAHENRLAYLALLEALEPFEGGLIPTLRTVVRLQLETMSWCIGTREL